MLLLLVLGVFVPGCPPDFAASCPDRANSPSALPSPGRSAAPGPRSRSHSAEAVFLSHSNPIVIPRLEVAPKLSDFLGKIGPAAAKMLQIDRFTERYPEDGNRPGNETTAYLGYSHQYFYAAFVCRDRKPNLIRAHMLARDCFGDDDNVQVMLDTFHDQRRAFVFESNPLGIQADALYSEQNGYDFSFDTVWDTWGRRTPWGYVVLMRIPLPAYISPKPIRDRCAPGESFWSAASRTQTSRITGRAATTILPAG